MVGFVPQDDLMMLELTVRENILYSARVRLPRSGWTAAAIERHVDAVIDVLGLSEVSNNLITAISGGQRKRTNIGIELAIAPTAIFLDEPTSGLDSASAFDVCTTLRAVADLGITVVAVIHQPRTEIFRSFDDLLLLSPGGDGVGGMTAYMGPQRFALPYFTEMGVRFNFNEADDLLDFMQNKGRAAEDAVDAGALKVLARLRARGNSGGSDADASFASVGIPGRTVSTQIAEYWALAGRARVAELRAADTANATPRAGGPLIDAEDVSTPPSARACVQGGGGADDAAHEPFDAEAATANRGASFLVQFLLAHNRSIVQQYRTATSFALELGVAMLAGGMMGAAALAVPSLYMGVLKAPYVYISPSPIENLLPSVGLFVGLAVGVAASPAGVKIFGEERFIYFREAASGHNRFAYYAAKTVAVLYRLTIGAYHFVSIFHTLVRWWAGPHSARDRKRVV